MLKFSDVQAYLEPRLQALGTYNPMPVFDPGPGVNIDALDTTPNTMVIISPWPGAGLDSEGLFDRAAVQIRSVGPQSDYNKAEQLALDIDRCMVFDFQISQLVNGKWWLTVTRAGGSPSLLLQDEGDRFHFYCNYIVEVEYG